MKHRNKQNVPKLIKRGICAFLSALLVAFSPVLASDAPHSHIFAANRSAGKYVAITFDDGPHPVYTEKILAILAENHAKATFFVVGQNAERYPELITKEFEAGHEIGNHTYSHPNMKKIGVSEAIAEIERTQEIVHDITGVYPKVFRSPGGIFSDELVSAVEGISCKPVSWSWRQDTRDWSKPPVETVIRTVLDNLRDGDIILFHDFNTKGSPTPDALAVILPELVKRGYSFVTVSELGTLKDGVCTSEQTN